MDKKWDKIFLDDLQYSELPNKNVSNQYNKQHRNDYYREYFKDQDKKQRHKRSVYKSHAKHFVKNFATEDEMNELCRIFKER